MKLSSGPTSRWQHEWLLGIPARPHSAAIRLQHSCSAGVSAAIGSRQAIVGAAVNSSTRANTPILAANFKRLSLLLLSRLVQRVRSADFYLYRSSNFSTFPFSVLGPAAQRPDNRQDQKCVALGGDGKRDEMENDFLKRNALEAQRRTRG